MDTAIPEGQGSLQMEDMRAGSGHFCLQTKGSQKEAEGKKKIMTPRNHSQEQQREGLVAPALKPLS